MPGREEVETVCQRVKQMSDEELAEIEAVQQKKLDRINVDSLDIPTVPGSVVKKKVLNDSISEVLLSNGVKVVLMKQKTEHNQVNFMLRRPQGYSMLADDDINFLDFSEKLQEVKADDLSRNVFRQVKKTHEGIRPYQAEIVIKKRGWGSLVAETVYTPPRGKGVVEKKMADWIDFLNDDSAYPVDPLLKMAMAHYQFEAIHPFRDGNGRTGRILCIIYLIQKGLLDLPILYLSAYILQNKDAYYYALNSVTGLRNWKAWILYMLEAVSQTSEYTIEKINRIRSLMEKTERIILENKLSLARLNLSKLFEQPYIRPKNLLSNTIKSVNTAKKYLSQLEGLGLLTKERIGKEYIWFNTELMAILSD